MLNFEECTIKGTFVVDGQDEWKSFSSDSHFLILIIPNSYRRLNRRIKVYMYIRVGYYEDLRAWCSNPHLIPLVRATAGRKLWWGCTSGCRTRAAMAAFFREARARMRESHRLEKKRGAKAIAQKDRFALLLGLLRAVPRVVLAVPNWSGWWWQMNKMWNFGDLGSKPSWCSVRNEYLFHPAWSCFYSAGSLALQLFVTDKEDLH